MVYRIVLLVTCYAGRRGDVLTYTDDIRHAFRLMAELPSGMVDIVPVATL